MSVYIANSIFTFCYLKVLIFLSAYDHFKQVAAATSLKLAAAGRELCARGSRVGSL